MLQCDPAICQAATCPGNDKAVCRINPCGKCKAEFLDEYGRAVQCKSCLRLLYSVGHVLKYVWESVHMVGCSVHYVLIWSAFCRYKTGLKSYTLIFFNKNKASHFLAEAKCS